MFFILSKTLNFFTNPLVLVGLLFVASVIIKKARIKKILFWISVSLLCFLSNDFIANEVITAWEIPPTPYSEITKSYQYGIVLTGVTNTDKEPNDRVYFQHGADRVVHAVQLYKKGIIRKIIISGGSGRILTEGRKEADDLFNAMILMGVPQADLITESESRNTYESAINVKAILGDTEETSLLITSAFHMRRSKGCFDKVEIPVDVFSTDFYSHPRYFIPETLLIPRLEALMIWQKLFKEWLGIVAYKMAGHI